MVEHDAVIPRITTVRHGEHVRAVTRSREPGEPSGSGSLGGMRRQCGRPGCSSVATVTFSFDATNCVVWLDPLADGTARAGDLCTRHADLLTPPRDWERVDRRPPRPEPVAMHAANTVAVPAATPAKAAAKRAPRRRSRVEQPVLQPAEPAWLPRNASDDDLDGVLDVSTPLLSRAFNQARPSESPTDNA
jgi:hypothetical protein